MRWVAAQRAVGYARDAHPPYKKCYESVFVALYPLLNVFQIEVEHPGGEFVDAESCLLFFVIVIPVAVIVLVHARVFLFEELA